METATRRIRRNITTMIAAAGSGHPLTAEAIVAQTRRLLERKAKRP
jgi:hypothetical protein